MLLPTSFHIPVTQTSGSRPQYHLRLSSALTSCQRSQLYLTHRSSIPYLYCQDLSSNPHYCLYSFSALFGTASFGDTRYNWQRNIPKAQLMTMTFTWKNQHEVFRSPPPHAYILPSPFNIPALILWLFPLLAHPPLLPRVFCWHHLSNPCPYFKQTFHVSDWWISKKNEETNGDVTLFLSSSFSGSFSTFSIQGPLWPLPTSVRKIL